MRLTASMLPWAACAAFLLLFAGCAERGVSYPDAQPVADLAGGTGGPTDVTQTPDPGSAVDPGVPTPDEGDEAEVPDIPLPPDEGDPPDAEEDVDPEAPWDCDDDGFVDELFGQCDWEWICDEKSYQITCTQQGAGGALQCQCRFKGTIIQKFPADEPCNALSTVNAANAYCMWNLPLPQ